MTEEHAREAGDHTSGAPYDPSNNHYDNPRETENTAYRDVNGLQTGVLNGIVNIGDNAGQVDLVARRATHVELRDVSDHFVRTRGLDEAEWILRRENLVILAGQDTGRTWAAMRLLCDVGVTAVATLNNQRALGSVREEELDPGLGYVWDVRDSADLPFREREVEECASVMRSSGCWLVVVLKDRGQAKDVARENTVGLDAPDPVEVALAAVRRHRPDDAEAPSSVVKNELSVALNPGDPPGKAAEAADLAIRVVEGELSPHDATQRVREDVSIAVARWFGDWTAREYPMALAVAVMEDEPYDEVVGLARKLDDAIRTAELPEDKNLRPRRVFDKPKAQILQDIRARVDERAHPRHQGLEEETVRFDRRGWAEALLCHAWQQHSSLEPILHEWLCWEISQHKARNALCTIIARVPAHEPLRVVSQLASRERWIDRKLAVQTLVNLAERHDLFPLVEQTLDQWAKSGGARQKWTAANVYGSSFGQRDFDDRHVLAQLAEIGLSSQQTPQKAVVGAVLTMLRQQEKRKMVIDHLVAWSDVRHRYEGLRQVSCGLTLWLVGIYTGEGLDFSSVSKEFRPQINTLFQRVLSDTEFGHHALEHLCDLTLRTRWSEESADKLIELASVIAPDLRWWRRRRAVKELVEQHPARRTDICRIFRTARGCQRRRKRRESGTRGMIRSLWTVL